MECLRCHGMMVGERYEDLRGDPHLISFHGWRCLCCGDVVDQVIARHRAAQLGMHTGLRCAIPERDLEAPAA